VDIATFIAMIMDLGAKIHGAETCYLGAMIHGAEVRVYFLKSFQKGHIREILLKKAKKQKSRSPSRLTVMRYTSFCACCEERAKSKL
jgi:hypothetical protein